MKIRVVDFETTDIPRKGRRVDIVEFGFTDLHDDGHTRLPCSGFVKPGVPISAEARGVHHISDDDVALGYEPEEARSILMADMEPGDLFAAHHAEFERGLFPGDPFPWICTMVCAKHLYPDAPGYGNQTLRYWLGIDRDFAFPALAMPPHRAAPDTYVTAHILARMIATAPAPRLVELTNTPVLLECVPFGKHEGQAWSLMDRGFLEWVLDPKRENMKPEVLHTARHWLSQISRFSNPF